MTVEALMLVVAASLLGLAATWFGEDSRALFTSPEERLASFGVRWPRG